MVLPASLQTRMFHLNYLDLQRARRLEDARQLGPDHAEPRERLGRRAATAAAGTEDEQQPQTSTPT